MDRMNGKPASVVIADDIRDKINQGILKHNDLLPSEKEIERARRNPCIVHFLGEERPWRVGNTNRFRKEYARFLTMTPWAGQGFEAGWELYFRFWRMFNSFTRPFPMLRLFVIQTLMPLMLKTKHR